MCHGGRGVEGLAEPPVPPENLVRVSITGLMTSPNVSSGECLPTIVRFGEHLEGPLQSPRCYYSFVRPHLGPKFGTEVRTPAMQAGLVAKRLTFREIFTAGVGLLLFVLILVDFRRQRRTIYEQRLAA